MSPPAIFGDVDSFVEVVRKSASHHKEPVLELSFDIRQDAPIDPVYLKRLKAGLCEYLGEHFHWGRPSDTREQSEPYRGL